jgi:hypothetical protein
MGPNPRIDPESCKPHRNCFFTRLPYDIRTIIYFYLESDDLSPLAPDPHCVNFLLSCRAAKQEIDELSSRRHAPFYAFFKETTGVELQIRNDQHSPRSLIATLPFTAFKNSGSSSRRLEWKREIIIALHPLLSQSLNSIRIHIASEPSTSLSSLSLLERAQVEMGVHSLLRDVGFMLARIQRTHQDPDTWPADNLKLETIFGYAQDGESALYPSAKVKVKRICISWDLRGNEKDVEMQLNGKLHHAQKVTEKADELLDPHYLPVAMFYHLRDTERIAGEMGLVSANRWALIHVEPLSLNTLINGIHTENESYASSGGLGREIRDGLIGTSAKEYEQQEEDVRRVLSET